MIKNVPVRVLKVRTIANRLDDAAFGPDAALGRKTLVAERSCGSLAGDAEEMTGRIADRLVCRGQAIVWESRENVQVGGRDPGAGQGQSVVLERLDDDLENDALLSLIQMNGIAFHQAP